MTKLCRFSMAEKRLKIAQKQSMLCRYFILCRNPALACDVRRVL